MNENIRVDQVRMVTRSKLNLNDYQWNIGDMWKDIEDGFDLEVTETRLLPYKNTF